MNNFKYNIATTTAATHVSNIWWLSSILQQYAMIVIAGYFMTRDELIWITIGLVAIHKSACKNTSIATAVERFLLYIMIFNKMRYPLLMSISVGVTCGQVVIQQGAIFAKEKYIAMGEQFSGEQFPFTLPLVEHIQTCSQLKWTMCKMEILVQTYAICSSILWIASIGAEPMFTWIYAAVSVSVFVVQVLEYVIAEW
jgi:hypothetical protein